MNIYRDDDTGFLEVILIRTGRKLRWVFSFSIRIALPGTYTGVYDAVDTVTVIGTAGVPPRLESCERSYKFAQRAGEPPRLIRGFANGNYPFRACHVF